MRLAIYGSIRLIRPISGTAAALILGFSFLSGGAVASRHALPDAIGLLMAAELPGSPQDAIKLTKHAIATAELHRGPLDPSVAKLLEQLGALYEAAGLKNEAELAYLKALAITERAFGANHPAIIGLTDSLASFYYREERNQEAEILIKRWISVSEMNLPSQLGNLVVGLNNLALLYAGQGKCDEAAPLFERAFQNAATVPEVSTDKFGAVAHRLALCRAGQGRADEAETYYKRARSLSSKTRSLIAHWSPGCYAILRFVMWGKAATRKQRKPH